MPIAPRLIRIGNSPIIAPDTPGADQNLGTNFNGPSLIRTPDWLPNPLGRYYLYFAHHQGQFIRLAFADTIQGPWTIYTPGTLRRDQTRYDRHIASPDVHVNHDNKRLVMYYHGCRNFDPACEYDQTTCIATSGDGLNWASGDRWITNSYLRVFTHRGQTYGLSMPGLLWRADPPTGSFTLRPGNLFGFELPPNPGGQPRRARHFAVDCLGDTLRLFYSRVGDTPERLLYAEMDLSRPFDQWRVEVEHELLRPKRDYEGSNLPVETSIKGAVHHPVHALRDPGFFRDLDHRQYLVYGVAGETAMALAALQGNE